MPARELLIANRYPRLHLDRRSVAKAVKTLDAHAKLFRGGCPTGELSLVFLSDAALAQLHADFLNDPSVTDVITFAGPAGLGAAAEIETAGEICVSVDAVLRQSRNARALRGGARAFERELTLYVVHGWLHLAGYDDLQPRKKRVMRRAETRALELLDAAQALPRFTLRPPR